MEYPYTAKLKEDFLAFTTDYGLVIINIKQIFI